LSTYTIDEMSVVDLHVHEHLVDIVGASERLVVIKDRLVGHEQHLDVERHGLLRRTVRVLLQILLVADPFFQNTLFHAKQKEKKNVCNC
jgi:hypothetical protein